MRTCDNPQCDSQPSIAIYWTSQSLCIDQDKQFCSSECADGWVKAQPPEALEALVYCYQIAFYSSKRHQKFYQASYYLTAHETHPFVDDEEGWWEEHEMRIEYGLFPIKNLQCFLFSQKPFFSVPQSKA